MRANSSEAVVISVFIYYLLRRCFILVDIQQIHLEYIEKRLKACNECK